MKKRFLNRTLFLWGAILSVLWVAVSTIVGETFHPFKDWLAATFGHHWVGKGIIAAALVLAFLFLAWIRGAREKMPIAVRLIWLLFWTALLGAAAILIFYAEHAF